MQHVFCFNWPSSSFFLDLQGMDKNNTFHMTKSWCDFLTLIDIWPKVYLAYAQISLLKLNLCILPYCNFVFKLSLINSMTYDDFRGITISPVISKFFEHCTMLEKFRYYGTDCYTPEIIVCQVFLSSGDNQFGFKKGLGCRNAIFTARNIVDQYIKGGNTANLCAIDLSKAFDKITTPFFWN